MEMIDKQQVLNLPRRKGYAVNGWETYIRVSDIEELPSVQPDNQTNLCDSCDYSYPECPSKNDDVIFGNGIGNDNICACNKYKPSTQPVRKKGGKWIDYSDEGYVECPFCHSATNCDGNKDELHYCFSCGAELR